MIGVFVPWHDTPRYKHSTVGYVIDGNGCHVWTGALRRGYGHIKVAGKMKDVHRVRYEREVGPIPDGMEMDHFACDNRACCNPSHVRPVTPRENTLRSNGIAARNAAKTSCARGHPFGASRRCVVCHNEANRRYRKNKQQRGG